MRSIHNQTFKTKLLRIIPLIAGFGLMITAILPAGSSAQSMKEYRQMAAEQNPEVRSAFYNYLSSLEERPQAGSLPDPEVAFAYFIEPVETRLGPQQARISVSQMFPWFGTLDTRRTLAGLRAKEQFEEFQEVRNRVFFRVESALVELYELEKSIEIARENLDILNTLVEISLRRYETNQATQVDVLRAQIELEDLKTELALLEDDRNLAGQRVLELLNRGRGFRVEAPDTLFPSGDMDERQLLLQRILQQNPTLSRLHYQELSSEERVELASKNGKPSFGLGLDYIFTGERNDVPNITGNGQDALIARASFRIPIFRKSNSAEVREAERSLRAAESRFTDRKNTLETDLDASLRDFYDAERQFRLYDEKQIQRVNQALSIMMQAYATDSSGFEEILRMQRKLLDYRLNRIRAVTDMHRSRAYIDYLTGRHNVNPESLSLNSNFD